MFPVHSVHMIIECILLRFKNMWNYQPYSSVYDIPHKLRFSVTNNMEKMDLFYQSPK